MLSADGHIRARSCQLTWTRDSAQQEMLCWAKHASETNAAHGTFTQVRLQDNIVHIRHSVRTAHEAGRRSSACACPATTPPPHQRPPAAAYDTLVLPVAGGTRGWCYSALLRGRPMLLSMLRQAVLVMHSCLHSSCRDSFLAQAAAGLKPLLTSC